MTYFLRKKSKSHHSKKLCKIANVNKTKSLITVSSSLQRYKSRRIKNLINFRNLCSSSKAKLTYLSKKALLGQPVEILTLR